MSDIVTLNVGGKLFTTTVTTLALPGSFFARMFDGKMQPGVMVDGGIFLDRNPKYFSHVLDYARYREGWECPIDPPLILALIEEGTYFGYDGMLDKIRGRIHPYRENFEVRLLIKNDSILGCAYGDPTPNNIANWLKDGLADSTTKNYSMAKYKMSYCDVIPKLLEETSPDHDLSCQVMIPGSDGAYYLLLSFCDRHSGPIYTAIREKLYPKKPEVNP